MITIHSLYPPLTVKIWLLFEIDVIDLESWRITIHSLYHLLTVTFWLLFEILILQIGKVEWTVVTSSTTTKA